MKIEIIGHGPLTPAQLDEILFGAPAIKRKSPLEEAMDKLINEVKRGDEKKYKAPICFDIQAIFANHKKNAFTVVWGDGSHTIIHLQPGDIWDDEKALAMCFVKHMMGDTGSFNDIFTEDMPAKIKHIGKVEPVEEKANDNDTKAFTRTITLTEEAVDKINKCECNPPCKECRCEVERAEETSVSTVLSGVKNEIADKIAELTDSKPLTSRIEGPYKVFIKSSNTIVPAGTSNALMSAGTYNTIKLAKERAIDLATQIMGSKPHYYRLWTDEGKLYIDFGSYSKYIVLEGVGTEDWYNV